MKLFSLSVSLLFTFFLLVTSHRIQVPGQLCNSEDVAVIINRGCIHRLNITNLFFAFNTLRKTIWIARICFLIYSGVKINFFPVNIYPLLISGLSHRIKINKSPEKFFFGDLSTFNQEYMLFLFLPLIKLKFLKDFIYVFRSNVT